MNRKERQSDINYLARATSWLQNRTISYELYDVLLTRDAVEDVWNKLGKKQEEIARAFDREVLRHIDWLLEVEPDLPFVGARMKIDRQYWWWYLHEIKAGTMQLPADLKGAA
jgi:hypothetical protein